MQSLRPMKVSLFTEVSLIQGCPYRRVTTVVVLHLHHEVCMLYTVPTKKEVTVMIIKPDIVKAGKVDEMIEQVNKNTHTHITIHTYANIHRQTHT